MTEPLQKFELPGRVQIVSGPASLPKIQVTSRYGTAEVYPHGAHVTQFQKNGEPPLLFLSRQSLFAADKAIRGGIPVCFPWFGAREGAGMHGVARLSEWELTETSEDQDGAVKLTFVLPPARLAQAGWPPAQVTLRLTVAEQLTLELAVLNATAKDFSFEDCLHTYFSVGDISQVEITGLKGVHYLDKVDQFARKLEAADAIKINSEVDRVYLSPTGTVQIRDAKWRRTISVRKSGSASTVVWNPWQAKARAMADLGDDEYQGMVCVESGNVGESRITLAPGQRAALQVVLSSQPWV
jgi:D-hexose-6-phosphate mutarotase